MAWKPQIQKSMRENKVRGKKRKYHASAARSDDPDRIKFLFAERIGSLLKIVKLLGHPVRTGQARRGFPAG
jgi:hypothetical protein